MKKKNIKCKYLSAHIQAVYLPNNRIRTSILDTTHVPRIPPPASPSIAKLPFKNTTVKKRRPVVPASDFWGFPVYYSPQNDTDEIQNQNEKKVKKKKRIMQKKTFQKEAQKEAVVQKVKKEQDDVKYLYYATRYGPLEGMLYVSTRFPGMGKFSRQYVVLVLVLILLIVVYEIVTHRCCRTLQAWFKERRIVLQKYYRTVVIKQCTTEWIHLAVQKILVQIEQDDTVQKSLRRLFLQHLVSCFLKWKSFAAKSRSAKLFLKRLVV